MNKTQKFSIDIKYKLLIFAAVLRVAFFAVDLYAGAINIDEAMASINAFEIAKSGNDLMGTHLPLYFDCWLYGGQSPVAIYLAAAAVKIFGATKFAVRLPVLIFNVLSLWAYFEFVYEIFDRKRYRIILCSVAAISPWSIFAAAYFLDCNYIAFFILFGLCFLVKAIKREKSLLFAVAMICFGLCFYCYIASVLIIPFLLAAIYLQLLASKKISIKNVFISILTIVFVSVPFVVLGLVTIGALPRGNFLGFSLTNMEYYSRQSSLSFASGSSVLNNFLSYFLYIICVDFSVLSEAINKFQYSNLLGGFFVAFELIYLLVCPKRKRHYDFLQKSIIIGLVVSTALYCFFVGEISSGLLHRLAPVNYILMFLEGLGIAELPLIFEKQFKVKRFGKTLLAVYLSVSLALFAATYTFLYLPQTKSTFLYLYGDTYFETLETAQVLGYEDFTIYCDNNKYNHHLSVFSRYYFYGEKEFIGWKEESVGRLEDVQPKQLTTDGSIKYSFESTLSAPCCIYPSQLSEKYYKEGYTVIEANGWEIAYK